LVEKSLIAATFAALAFGPSQAFAVELDKQDLDGDGILDSDEEEVDAGVDDEVDAKKEKRKDWRVGAVVSTTVGSGTFVNVSNDTPLAEEVGEGDNAFDTIAGFVSVNGSYKLDDFTFALRMSVSQGLTSNDGINSPFEARFQDIGLSAAWAGYNIEAIDARVNANLGLSLPTSDVSQAQTRILGTRLGASISKTFLERLNVSFSGGVGKNFHQFTSPVVNINEAGEGNVLFRRGGAEVVDDNVIAVGRVNTEWSISGSLNASFGITDGLSAAFSYGLGNAWGYDVPSRNVRDEFTSPFARTGRISRQFVTSSAVLNYSFAKYFFASAGLSTSAPPLTNDNRSFRFPFYDLEGGGAANRSAFSFSVGGSY
jgi:hypothetical protein